MLSESIPNPVLKNTETPKAKPTFRIKRIKPKPEPTLKDISEEIKSLQKSVAHLTYRLSKLDSLVSRQRESGWY